MVSGEWISRLPRRSTSAFFPSSEVSPLTLPPRLYMVVENSGDIWWSAKAIRPSWNVIEAIRTFFCWPATAGAPGAAGGDVRGTGVGDGWAGFAVSPSFFGGV